MTPSAVPRRRVKVLWLIKGLGPGGAEQLLLLSAKVVDVEHFDVRVAYLRPDKTHLVPEFEQLGLQPARLGAGSRHRGGWMRELRHMMRDVDVVHAHSPVLASFARLLTRTLPRRHRPVLVATEHNEWSSHRAPTRFLNGVTAPLDAHHWTVSDQVRQTVWPWLRRSYPVLIHGIDTEAAKPDPDVRARTRSSLGVADDEILLLTVANLRRNKDYPNLLHAARAALDADPRLRFAAVGQGPLADEVEELHAQLALGERFSLLGFRRDISALMSAADIFVLASAYEGLPVAVMEAMAAGLPVVATAVGGLPQQVTDHVEGVLVPPRDARALAAAVLAVAADPALRHRMGEAARARRPEFDIRRAVDAQQAAYASLARR